MTDVRKKGRLVQQPFQNISNNYEQIRGERISLAQAVAAADPSTGDAIKQDRRFAETKEIQNPVTPKRGEATVEKNLDQAIPINKVKGLMEIKLKNNSRRGPTVAAFQKVSSIDKVIGDTAAKNKPSLISAHKGRDMGLKAPGEQLGDALNGAILETDGSKVSRGTRNIFFGKQNNVRPIDTFKIYATVVERIKQGENGGGGDVPAGFVGQPKAIRPGARNTMHRKEGRFNFFRLKGSI